MSARDLLSVHFFQGDDVRQIDQFTGTSLTEDSDNTAARSNELGMRNVERPSVRKMKPERSKAGASDAVANFFKVHLDVIKNGSISMQPAGHCNEGVRF